MSSKGSVEEMGDRKRETCWKKTENTHIDVLLHWELKMLLNSLYAYANSHFPLVVKFTELTDTLITRLFCSAGSLHNIHLSHAQEWFKTESKFIKIRKVTAPYVHAKAFSALIPVKHEHDIYTFFTLCPSVRNRFSRVHNMECDE